VPGIVDAPLKAPTIAARMSLTGLNIATRIRGLLLAASSTHVRTGRLPPRALEAELEDHLSERYARETLDMAIE
jgi:hypothetical protein